MAEIFDLAAGLEHAVPVFDAPAQAIPFKDFEGLLSGCHRQGGQQEPIPDSYWQHLEFNLERCEDYWSLKQETLPDRAYPFLEQANTASPDVSSPQPTTKRNPKQMMMFTFILLLIDGGTYSQA